MRQKGIAFLDDKESRKLLETHCDRIGVPMSVVEALIQVEIDVVGLERRDGLFERMHEIVRDDVELDDDLGEVG